MTIPTNSASIQIALYGVAHGHISHYVEEFSKLTAAQIIGVFDADSERALSFCDRHKLRKFDNPEELLNDLIEDGWTMKDALTEIMRDAIIENRLSNSYPDYVGVSYEYDEDEVTIELEKL